MRGPPRAGFAVASAGLCAALWPATAGAAPACAPAVSPADEVVLTELINAQRHAEGVPRVVTQPALVAAGRRKSMAMARGGAFNHSGSLAFAQGGAGAQNIAEAPTVQVAFQSMLASPAHRRAMLARAFRRTGVGAARDCAGQIFFTVNLTAG